MNGQTGKTFHLRKEPGTQNVEWPVVAAVLGVHQFEELLSGI
jgi:hypothetical protein